MKTTEFKMVSGNNTTIFKGFDEQCPEDTEFLEKNNGNVKLDTIGFAEEWVELVDYDKSYAKEQKFINLFKNCIIKIDEIKYPNYVFIFKSDECLADYNLENGCFDFDHNLIWSVFETEYSMGNKQIRGFLKDMVEKHFNCKDVTSTSRTSWATARVEKHFKCKNNIIRGLL